MDCDDDDILRHNLHLAGESRSRSSALKPYDFPKFEFDDNLQGHLRFDSLVETEVFLGIQSQEDSQWIEDYSRGSNGMEFNSNPADSCSISRRDNVWSEATSSESVEMLLKSVGQEEMIPAASVMLGTNVCDDQDASGRHAESISEPGVNNLDTATENDEECIGNPILNRQLEEQLPKAVDPTNVESSCKISQNATQKSLLASGDSAMDGKSHRYSESAKSGEKPISFVDEGKSSNCTNNNDEPDPHLAMPSSSEAPQHTDTDVPPISCNEDGKEQQILTGAGVEDIMKKIGERPCDISTVDSSPFIAKESETVNSVDAVDACLDSPRNLVIASSAGEDELKLFEVDEKFPSLTASGQTGDCEVKGLSVSSDVKDPFLGCQVESSEDGSNQHSADLGRFKADDGASAEQKVASPEQLVPREDGKIEDVQTSQRQSMALSERSPFSVKNDGVSVETDDCFKDCNDVELLSSNPENNKSGNFEGSHNESAVIQEEPSASAPGIGEEDSEQVIKGNLARTKADSPVSSLANFENEGQDGKLSVVGSENVETLTSGPVTQCLGVDEGVKVNESHRDIQNQTSGGMVAGTELAPLPECSVMAATVSSSVFEKMGSVAALSDSDKVCDEDGKTKLSDMSFITEVSTVSEVEVCVAGDSGQNSLSSAAAKDQHVVEKCNEISSDRFPCAKATTSFHLDNSTVNSSYRKSALKSSDTEVVTNKLEPDQEAPHIEEVDKASCGSPTIISSNEPSALEKDDQEEPMALEVRDKFVEGTQPVSENVKGKDSLGDDSSFTFKVNALPETSREPSKSWSPFCDTKNSHSPIVLKESLPSGKGKTESMSSPKTPLQNARVPDVDLGHGSSKGASERKGKRASSRGASKESAKKGSRAKGANQETATGRQDKASMHSAPSSFPLVQFGQLQSCGDVDTSKTKLTDAGVFPTSSFSGLNASPGSKSSVPPSSGVRQPFSDLQQVQLRAQIFVYGSLIQGSAPDEACMVSAFGSSDLGRSSWEPTWRAAVERVRSQKSNSSATETPLPLRSGVRASDSAVKQSSHSSKVIAASVSKVSSKDTPATIASPMIPLSSPLWNISTPSRDSLPSSTMHKGPLMNFQQPAAPFQSYQTPPMRSFIGHTSWQSQTCFPNPWLTTPQSPVLNSTVRFQPVTMTETVKLMPVKDTSLPPPSDVKHVTPNSPAHTTGPSPVYKGSSSVQDSKLISSPDLHSGELKPRKRKKGLASEPLQSGSVSDAQTVPVVFQSVGLPQSSPVGAPAAIAPVQEAVMGKPTGDALAVCSTEIPKKYEVDTGSTGAFSEETLKNVAEAKAEAEDAAGLATAAITQCEELWGKLTKQKESGLTLEAEAKLVSAAAAIAAASSVAKAAAAAAKIACSAALQAKLMADEALFPNKFCSAVPAPSDIHDIKNASPASMLKSDKSSNKSSSILIAAKEAARRRVEAATAASRQAENLDAIVKAAELAAAAVSHAGKIVAMGEPLLLNDLIEAGPEGFWKLPVSPELVQETSKTQPAGIGLKEDVKVSGKAAGEYSAEKGGSRKTGRAKINRRERLKNSVDGQLRGADSVAVEECMPGTDGVKSAVFVFESDGTQRNNHPENEHDELAGTLPDDNIKEGSPIEVYKFGDGLKSAWYSANVLRLEDAKAYVCYNDLSSDEGTGNLCEWVCLGSEGERGPVVRVAHPLNLLQYQGTRKRRRAALGDYAWCIGDKVDVWIDDCWLEGVVTEKNENDETTLTVHFPAQGETLTVRAWNLRTSRSWINGKWVEWSSLRTHNSSDQSDAPLEKRQKLGSPALAAKGKDKSSKESDLAMRKPEESKLLSLSTSERTFDIGKTVKEDNKYTGRRPLRSGQQKEGPRVVFGVPKPTGKKRKFMEVSKQFPANKADKSNEAAESIKSAKYLVHQGAGSRGWKIPSRNDPRDKRTVETRPRLPGTRKSQRTLPRRDNVDSASGHDSDNGTDHGTDAEDLAGGDDASEKVDRGSTKRDEAVEAPLSSLLPNPLSVISKRTISSNNKSERLTRGKLATPGAKLSIIEEHKVYTANSGKVGPDSSEPRRSNRRFQPTHRLLEGLQSSMIIPKMPSVSHVKVQRSQNRGVLTRGK